MIVHDLDVFDKRVKKEEKRIRLLLKDIDHIKIKIADGLIQRAAHMRIMLEEYERDILVNGCTEPFTQSSNMMPYDRTRPVVQQYQSMMSNFQKCMKDLNALSSKNEVKKTDKDDKFSQFMNAGRDT